MRRNNEELSQTIIDTLCERKGFDNWWYDLDDDIQEEILEQIQENIAEWMDEEPYCSK